MFCSHFWFLLGELSVFFSLAIKVVNDHFPLRLHELFQTTSQVHTYNLRNSAHTLFISRPLSEAEKCSLHYRDATLWNSLSTTSKTQTTATGFKESLLT